MSAVEYNTTVEQGATFRRTLTLRDADGDPIDVTGWTGTGKVKERYDSAATIATITVATNEDGTDGEVHISMSAIVTAAIPCDKSKTVAKRPTYYVYDVECTKLDGDKVRLVEGVLKVTPEVTV